MGEMTSSRPRCIKRAPNINEFLPLRNDASSVDCFGQLNLGFQVLVDSVSANTLDQNLQILRNPVVRFGMKWLISHFSDKKKTFAEVWTNFDIECLKDKITPRHSESSNKHCKNCAGRDCTGCLLFRHLECDFRFISIPDLDSVACVTF